MSKESQFLSHGTCTYLCGGVLMENFLANLAVTTLTMWTSIQQVPNKCWFYCTDHIGAYGQSPTCHPLPCLSCTSAKSLGPKEALAMRYAHQEGAPCGGSVWTSGAQAGPALLHSKHTGRRAVRTRQARRAKGQALGADSRGIYPGPGAPAALLLPTLSLSFLICQVDGTTLREMLLI